MKGSAPRFSTIPTRPGWLALWFLLAACQSHDRPRCAECGMFVDLAPRWVAGLPSGERFDAPRCLFRWSASHGRNAARDGWVTEYYSQSRRDVNNVVFVVGSDVIGPMGADLIPVVGGERATRFASDHGGRIVRPADVDGALLRALDEP